MVVPFQFLTLLNIMVVFAEPILENCCGQDVISNPNKLFECSQFWTNSSMKESSLSLITYLSPSIHDYAAYALAVNSMYADLHDASFLVGTPANGQNFEPLDARWNKVYMLYNSLDPLEGFSKSSDVVVWIDADLIFLNLHLNLLEIAKNFSMADIILSKDLDGSATIANTGLIMVRNTQWAREFLHKWWSSYDRSKCCDQDALSWLYRELPLKMRSKIALLPSDALNSNFPAWKNQLPDNPVLHLAGATTLYRKPAFSYAWNHVCDVVTNALPEKQNEKSFSEINRISRLKFNDQLGLNREKLQQLIFNLPKKRIEAVTELFNQLNLIPSNLLTTQLLRSALDRIEDYVKRDDAENELLQLNIIPHINETETILLANELTVVTVATKRWIFDSLRNMTERMYSTIVNHTVHKDNLEMIEYAELLRTSISTAFELAMSMNADTYLADRVALLSVDVPPLLESFLQSLPDELRHRGLYYKFKHREMLGNHLLHSDTQQSIQILQEALDVWKELAKLNYFGTDYAMVDPYKEGISVMHILGSILCMNEVNHVGIPIFEEAIKYYKLTFKGFKDNILATADVIHRTEGGYIDTLVNAGLCYHFSEYYVPLQRAMKHFKLAIKLLEKRGVDATTSHSYRMATEYLDIVQKRIERGEVDPEVDDHDSL